MPPAVPGALGRPFSLPPPLGARRGLRPRGVTVQAQLIFLPQPQHSHLVIQQLLGHLDANSRSAATVRAGIVEVLSEAAVIAATGSVGKGHGEGLRAGDPAEAAASSREMQGATGRGRFPREKSAEKLEAQRKPRPEGCVGLPCLLAVQGGGGCQP